MWINGKALHEIATAELTEMRDAEIASNGAQTVWAQAFTEELQFRDRNPEYHF
jgi:hypothetical protein